MSNNVDVVRKARAWEWVARIRDIVVVPLIVVLLVQWADVRHVVAEWPAHQMDHLEATEIRAATSVKIDYLSKQVSELQEQLREVTMLIKSGR